MTLREGEVNDARHGDNGKHYERGRRGQHKMSRWGAM
jgi:hypothetical protein